ncbi:PhzF family phenazine biosynthesis protein [Rhodoferax lacus]|nr:PhzF family phenazine biosynthesis protein [Rhodoferax lacus]
MPRLHPFLQVDVFTAQPYYGNALAVVLDAAEVSDADMQRFAMWTNLAETTFILPPTPEAAAEGADYQVRIFTTAYEMPFAGHPTLGSCHAWLERGGVPRDADCIVQQCKVGLVRIRRAGTRLAFAAPALQRQDIASDLQPSLLVALGLQPHQVLASQRLVNGPSHFGLLLDSADSVLELAPDFSALKAVLAQSGCSGVGVAAVAAAGPQTGLIRRSNREARAFGGNTMAEHSEAEDEPSVEVRMFVSDLAVAEDPITGSFNASLAQWLIAEGHAPTRYVAAQGTCIGRAGRVYIEQDASGQVWVGGDSVTCIAGVASL